MWNCKNPTHCPFCIEGSEYRPIRKDVPFPLQAQRARERKTAKREHKKSAAYQSGRRSKQKGGRLEREVCKIFSGIRVPLSGIMDGHPNDAILQNGWRVEVKGRRTGLGLLYRWLDNVDVVAFRAPGEPWFFAMAGARFKIWNGASTASVRAAKKAIGRLDPPAFEIDLPGGGVMTPRERRGGFGTIRGWLDAEHAEALFFKADRKEWLVIMDGTHFVELLTKDSAHWPKIGTA